MDGLELAKARGIRVGEWEGTLLVGRLEWVCFSEYIGKFVVGFHPFGVATIAPENLCLFEEERPLLNRIGEWWLILYAEDGDIWCRETRRTSLAGRIGAALAARMGRTPWRQRIGALWYRLARRFA
jgi:hypothetical protein